uniref:Uncharacterized protein n=1 Tax=Oryza punctata TaxID=4537 RepID=A0A0E0L129_ORYPU
MIVVDEDQNQNSSALESDFTNSPVEKIELVECRMAKSPWFLRIHHIDRDESVTVPFYQWVETAEHQELASIWVAHKLPHYIELTGQSIRDVFVGAIDSTHDIVDISIRRLRQLDFDMCKAHSADHWRHYIESDFALLCLAGEDPIRSKSVRAQFTGQSVHYNIRKCRMDWRTYFNSFKMALLYELLQTKGNNGVVPATFLECMEE